MTPLTHAPVPSRRSLLAAAAASAAGGILLSRSTLAQGQSQTQPANAVPDEEKVGFAIVGLGGFSMRQMLPNFKNTRYCKPVFLVTGDPENKGRRVAEEYGIDPKNICTYEQMTERLGNNDQVQVVYIATPTGLHHRDTLAGFAAGKHVMCEKPMASSVQECDEMIQAGEQAGKQLMIAYRVHFEPYNLRAMEMSQSEEMGPVRQVSTLHHQGVPADTWRTDPQLNGGGGPLMDLGVYGVQAACYLTGEVPNKLTGITYWPEESDKFGPGAEARCLWQFQFPSGATASGSTGWDGGSTNRFRAVKQDGWVELDPATGYSGHRLFISGRGGRQEITDQVQPGNQFAGELDHMAECVRESKKPRTPGEMGRRDVYLMKKIYESAETGKTLEV